GVLTVRARTGWGRAGVAAALVGLCTSCAFHGIDLVQDTRIRVDLPRNGATVTLPLTVSWQATSSIGRPGQRVQYAVFVDRTVVKPGRDLRSLVPDTDRVCLDDPACPDPEYLSRHDVYLVDQPTAVIPRLPRPATKGARETHRIIVVILVDGHRQGEGAFSRTVYLANQT
ncbi:MAG: hypothetical protein M3N21_07165, partial [Actinomycetota bacterium]|nr:hypothetical protein [Actinomycetota bacterium]